MLDKLYTRIGTLVSLEVLKIKSQGVSVRPNGVLNQIPFRTTSLPSLLALEDAATGQLGFLSKWSGLIKLQDLYGSFLWTTKETMARMGKREVDWVVAYLPALRRAAFLGMRYSDTTSDDIRSSCRVSIGDN
ncbi:hypothetical protein BG015_010958 [Linnemannia schmuckeri]|uniref:Uncharacterized protein n=1 Tax=Linnemannia schmuckeri TaxID=64567 RepID=A0A9P5V886_9FUNG|nr:hypothetical protein BG015_010958 [Linnemannia schmuckeri]